MAYKLGKYEFDSAAQFQAAKRDQLRISRLKKDGRSTAEVARNYKRQVRELDMQFETIVGLDFIKELNRKAFIEEDSLARYMRPTAYRYVDESLYIDELPDEEETHIRMPVRVKPGVNVPLIFRRASMAILGAALLFVIFTFAREAYHDYLSDRNLARIQQMSVQAAEADGTQREERAANSAFAGKRILLVEDDESNRQLEKTIFEDAGFIVDTAVNGEDAVRGYRLYCLAVIVVHGVDGTALARFFHMDISAVPDDGAQDLSESGVFGYLLGDYVAGAGERGGGVRNALFPAYEISRDLIERPVVSFLLHQQDEGEILEPSLPRVGGAGAALRAEGAVDIIELGDAGGRLYRRSELGGELPLIFERRDDLLTPVVEAAEVFEPLAELS